MPRLILAVFTFFFLVGIPERTQCNNEELDSLSLQQAQVYLDSLWAIYEVRDTDEDYARKRMHAFLDAWADEGRKEVSNSPRDSMAKLCDEVINITFRPRFPHLAEHYRPEDSAQLTSQGEYIVVRDSIRYSVAEDAMDWDTLASQSYWEPMVTGRILSQLTYRKWRPRLQSPRKVLYLDEGRNVAFRAFLNGHTDLQDYRFKKSENDIRFTWVDSFFPICPGHWGDYYGLPTLKAVGRFIFSPSMKKVIVSIADGCFTGSKAILIQRDDGWQQETTFGHWVE
ncbi:hypothetical protein KQI65_10170 [bacterium]|nr:hypothetical protein [bacterium]